MVNLSRKPRVTVALLVFFGFLILCPLWQQSRSSNSVISSPVTKIATSNGHSPLPVRSRTPAFVGECDPFEELRLNGELDPIHLCEKMLNRVDLAQYITNLLTTELGVGEGDWWLIKGSLINAARHGAMIVDPTDIDIQILLRPGHGPVSELAEDSTCWQNLLRGDPAAFAQVTAMIRKWASPVLEDRAGFLVGGGASQHFPLNLRLKMYTAFAPSDPRIAARAPLFMRSLERTPLDRTPRKPHALALKAELFFAFADVKKEWLFNGFFMLPYSDVLPARPCALRTRKLDFTTGKRVPYETLALFNCPHSPHRLLLEMMWCKMASEVEGCLLVPHRDAISVRANDSETLYVTGTDKNQSQARIQRMMSPILKTVAGLQRCSLASLAALVPSFDPRRLTCAPHCCGYGPGTGRCTKENLDGLAMALSSDACALGSPCLESRVVQWLRKQVEGEGGWEGGANVDAACFAKDDAKRSKVLSQCFVGPALLQPTD